MRAASMIGVSSRAKLLSKVHVGLETTLSGKGDRRRLALRVGALASA